jgi:alanine dehydrogenase
MTVGTVKEIKTDESRVALSPAGVRALKAAGHRVLVERGAGAGSAITEEEYREAGAEIIESAKEVFASSDIVVKVKEPQPQEYAFFREGLIVFTFFHLATKPELAKELLKKNVTAVAYETVEEDGNLPILKPMSEIAGKLSVHAGAHFLMKPYGGRGVLLGGVAGIERGKVAILGAGTVGENALKTAVGLGSQTTVVDVNTERLRRLDDLFGGKISTLYADPDNIKRTVRECDLLIGAVHIAGKRTPRLVAGELVSAMKKGSVIVDVSVDQGGCVETIRATTHTAPVYELYGVLHYGVTNMPGAVPRSSTLALTNATLPYLVKLANLGEKALEVDAALKKGVNTKGGKICHKNVAEALTAH